MSVQTAALALDRATDTLERELTAASQRPRTLTITKLARDEAGVWRARVTGTDGVTVDVDRRWGSWQAEVRSSPRSRTFERRDVLPHVALALQDKVRPLEKAERAAAKQAEEAACRT
jgi:hypothetical protein